MTRPVHCEPSDAQLAAIAAHEPDGPFVALNLNRYRPKAEYPDGTAQAEVSGREAYLRYGAIALAAIREVGGEILWAADVGRLAIGCDHDAFDEVVAVWYPSRKAFLALEEYPGYREAFELHRRAAIEHAVLLCCEGACEPVLRSPFG